MHILFIIAIIIAVTSIILAILAYYNTNLKMDKLGNAIGTFVAGMIVTGMFVLFGSTEVSTNNKIEDYNDKYDIHVTVLGDDYVRYNDGKCYAARVEGSDALMQVGCIDVKEVGD